MDLLKKILSLIFIVFSLTACSKKDPEPEEKETTVTDFDGNTYKTVKIAGKEWMAENLKVIHYRNGDEVAFISGEPWDNQLSGAWCIYNNNQALKTPYGLLYNWYAVSDSRGLCPDGWHIPSYAEWEALSTSNMELKEEGTSHWFDPNNCLATFSGLNVLPGGNAGFDGSYNTMGGNGYYWTATEEDLETSWMSFFSYMHTGQSGWINMNKWIGASVRCVKD